MENDLYQVINVPHYFLFVRGIHWWLVDFAHKGAVIQKCRIHLFKSCWVGNKLSEVIKAPEVMSEIWGWPTLGLNSLSNQWCLMQHGGWPRIQGTLNQLTHTMLNLSWTYICKLLWHCKEEILLHDTNLPILQNQHHGSIYTYLYIITLF